MRYNLKLDSNDTIVILDSSAGSQSFKTIYGECTITVNIALRNSVSSDANQPLVFSSELLQLLESRNFLTTVLNTT